MRKKANLLQDAHVIAWIILGVMIIGTLIFFDYFKQFFLRIALIGFLFIIFYFIDGWIFTTVGNSAKDFLSGGLFVKRWKTFPIFLAEIYIIYWLSSLLENWLENYLSPDLIKWWYVLIWTGIMFLFYWFKGSHEE